MRISIVSFFGLALLGALACDGDEGDVSGGAAGTPGAGGAAGAPGAGGASGTGDGVAGAGGQGGGAASPWSPAPAIGSGPLQETAAVALDGRIYVLGGLTGLLTFSEKVWVYDVVGRAWSNAPDLPRQAHHVNAAVVGDTIYVTGALVSLTFAPIGDVWAYTPAVDAGWRTLASMPAGAERGSSVVGVVGGKIYLAGGLRGEAVADVSSYDPASGTWDVALPPLPEPRDHGCGGVIGGKFYVVGGRQREIASHSPRAFEYTPGSAWVEKAAMPTTRGGMGCGVINDRLYVVGGEGNVAAPSGVFPQTEVFDPVADRWQSLELMLTPRHGMGAAVWEGALYVPGGASNESFGPVDVHEVLRP